MFACLCVYVCVCVCGSVCVSLCVCLGKYELWCKCGSQKTTLGSQLFLGTLKTKMYLFYVYECCALM